MPASASGGTDRSIDGCPVPEPHFIRVAGGLPVSAAGTIEQTFDDRQ